ncbi:MAG TPA: cysteine desulfurase family protein [Gemmatimonadaceae bacterium]
MPEPIYLDHAATTPVRPEVVEAMTPFYGPRFGNPSSLHRWGREARTALDEARERLANCIGARSDEVFFTSGGTEADNIAILGAWRARKGEGRNAIVTTPIEHKAVLSAVHQAAHEGAQERLCRVDHSGSVDVAHYNELTQDGVAIVSVMWVNNEIGTMQPIATLAARAKERGALFHTDGVQAFGKVDVDARKIPFDALALSGHKIGAPKGCGAIFIRRGTVLESLFHGGDQERGRRPGTENVAAAIGLAKAAEMTVAEREKECARVVALRERLERGLKANIPDAVIHGLGAPERAPHVVNVSVPGTDSESMLMALDLQGIGCSAGSACQSGSASPSHVLTAIGAGRDLVNSAIRMSLGSMSNEASVDRVIQVFTKLVNKARGMATASA